MAMADSMPLLPPSDDVELIARSICPKLAEPFRCENSACGLEDADGLANTRMVKVSPVIGWTAPKLTPPLVTRAPRNATPLGPGAYESLDAAEPCRPPTRSLFWTAPEKTKAISLPMPFLFTLTAVCGCLVHTEIIRCTGCKRGSDRQHYQTPPDRPLSWLMRSARCRSRDASAFAH